MNRTWVLRAIAARARALLLAGGLLALLAGWPYLQNTFDRLTKSASANNGIAGDTEYWCPMCPGVVSDWPAKCPVCQMVLIRRRKGEMTPLPDGALARVQLSPYRLQLAGIHTAPIEYQKLEYEVTVAGLLEASEPSALMLTGETFDSAAAFLTPGQEVTVSADDAPGELVPGRVVETLPAVAAGAGRRVRLRVENPRGELRPGRYAAATCRVSAARLGAATRAELDHWRDRTFLELLNPNPGAGLPALVEAAGRRAALAAGLTLAVPEPAVIDSGTRRVVFVESMPGVFDAVEVRLGRRAGGYYPVRAGLLPGQRVATAGAILLDAETRLNPSLAASYFGSGPRPTKATPSQSDEDRLLMERQKVCPVTKLPLDSMGGPVRVVVNGRVVFLCCAGCEETLREQAATLLPKLPR